MTVGDEVGVRVGVLVEVGTGRLPSETVSALLREPSGLPARVTAPAAGLFLERVLYPGDEGLLPLAPAFAVGAAPSVARLPKEARAPR